MNQFQTQTEFYKQRDLGEKINATFDFLLKNFKEIFPFMFKKVLPIVLAINIIPAFLPEFFISNGVNQNISESGLLITLFYFLGYVIAIVFAQSIIISMLYKKNIVLAQEEPEYYDLNEKINGNFMKIFVTNLLVVLITGGFTLLLIIPGIIVGVMLNYAAIVAVFEKISPSKAISRCWNFGLTKWWSTFGLMIIIGIISGIANFIFSIPEAVFTFVNIFLSNGNVDTTDFGYGIIFYVLHSISVFGAIVLSTVTYVALTYQYANIREIKESVSINDKISKFDEL